MPFTRLAGRPDLPALEQEVLARWEQTGVFARSLEQTAGGPLWVFYEGPPTANGKPGAHHVEARVFKDLFPRFKTMQGFHVPRQSSSPSRRSSASPASATSRPTAWPSSTPAAGSR